MKSPGVKLSHSVIVRAPGLLPMLYSVRELAEAIGGVDRTVRDWLQHGAPHQRDQQGHIWIHGQEFAAWVIQNRKPKRVRRLKDGEGYCFRCKQVVQIASPVTSRLRSKLTMTRGSCPQCGSTINRAGRIPSLPKAAFSISER